MRIFIPCESDPAETRVALLPEAVARLSGLGAQVCIEAGLGDRLNIGDEAYRSAGAAVSAERRQELAQADLILRLNKPEIAEAELLRQGAIHVSLLDPFRNPELVRTLSRRSVSTVSLEMIPRTTVAQKMDVLSSQSNLAGYAAVVLAASRLDRIFPLMMTPAGTLSPARVFVVGAGVAGLQAIATARRLGARVDAFDVRPETEEQVKSLGARFVKVDLGGEAGGTEQGYARELTQEQLERQRNAMARQCAQSDIVIAAAQVFGRQAPRLITAEMRKEMRPGSVIVDLAVDTGGNVDGSEIDREVTLDGVHILGWAQPARHVPWSASQMLSNNLAAFVAHFWDAQSRAFQIRLEDDIMKGCLITHQGEIRHEKIRELAAAAS